MSLFGSPPERERGASSSGLFDGAPAPTKKGSGLFADDDLSVEENEAPAPANLVAPEPAKDSSEQHSSTLPMNKPDYPDDSADPWASAATKQQLHAASNGQHDSHATERTTSSYTATESMGGSSDMTSAGFGGTLPRDSGHHAAPRPRQRVSTGDEEILAVATIPEKEGMFLFQHRNYEVSSNKRSSTVIRRYSDFVWLLDCLHKRYPFRQLPLLPPKRVSINGNHIAADGSFLEKRRKGLARFANTIIRHPVLKDEQLVTMFLTVPTELAAWRKQASISVQEEFVGRSLPPTLEDSLPASLEDLFSTVRAGVTTSAETYINMCALMERLLRRREGLASDYSRLSSSLKSLCQVSNDAFHLDTNDVPLLNEGINSTADHVAKHERLLADESASWDAGVMEDFKRQRDCLVSMRDMFVRRDLYAKDNIPQLERRIAGNEDKLAKVMAKPEGVRKSGEAQKVEEAIDKDKKSIVYQHARGVFIKECVRDEIRHFQSLQYDIGRSHQDWMAERTKDADAQADNWKLCAEQVENMPTSQG